ncbi:hypothetical protein Ade02nite_84300 [Paractinoplanes deccanensis]|uniref:TIR domain-containing protein n=2 Tax=Paractinoplanes deccanensis TaxID=113561 RepID=A0ABQ3YIH5_9ACTN|nr:hypothetical protein Ade02nite_84300 [Actinoplanes deccanensis]
MEPGTPGTGDATDALAGLIGECAVFAVLLTSRSVHRPWVRWELSHALRLGKRIAPIAGEQDLLLPPPFDRLPRVTHLPLRPMGTLATRLARLHPAAAYGGGGGRHPCPQALQGANTRVS